MGWGGREWLSHAITPHAARHRPHAKCGNQALGLGCRDGPAEREHRTRDGALLDAVSRFSGGRGGARTHGQGLKSPRTPTEIERSASRSEETPAGIHRRPSADEHRGHGEMAWEGSPPLKRDCAPDARQSKERARRKGGLTGSPVRPTSASSLSRRFDDRPAPLGVPHPPSPRRAR